MSYINSRGYPQCEIITATSELKARKIADIIIAKDYQDTGQKPDFRKTVKPLIIK